MQGLRYEVTKGGAIVSTRPSVSSLSSRYDHFLFAPICEDANGMQLSVLSALARMDVDPWEEATRLAAMPKAIAGRTLVATLDRVLGKSSNPSETEVIAGRLVQLLPQRAKVGQLHQRGLQESARNRLIGWCGWALR